jgi:hypothetical protein
MTGIGAKGHETANHFAALKKAESEGYEAPGTHTAAVAELWQRDPQRAERIGLPKLERGDDGSAPAPGAAPVVSSNETAITPAAAALPEVQS